MNKRLQNKLEKEIRVIPDFPIKGISSINFDCRYSFFKKRMDKIFNISTKEYFRLTKFKKNYDLGVNQKNQSIERILKIINNYTKKNWDLSRGLKI